MNGRSSGILSAIVRFSLRFRGVVIALTFLLAGFGVYSLTKAKYDVFPEFAPPLGSTSLLVGRLRDKPAGVGAA